MSNLLYIALVYYFSLFFVEVTSTKTIVLFSPFRGKKNSKKRAVSSLSSAIALLKLKVSLIMKKKGDK